MGNTFDSKAGKMQTRNSIDEESYLTNPEKTAIRQLYSKIKPDKVVSKEAIVEIFGGSEKLVFSECICEWIEKNVSSIAEFETLVIQLCRMESNTTVKTLWNLLSNRSQQYKENNVLLFFGIIVVLSLPDDFFVNSEDGSKLTQSVASQANNMLEFFTNSMKKQDPNFDVKDITSVTMCGWINNYAPHIPKVVESYVSQRCFKDVLSPSFKPFLAPILVSTSSAYANGSIMNELELLPLALANPNLQDVWQQLYSSAVDGSSFNRIVHHILGYDVMETVNLSLFNLIFIFVGSHLYHYQVCRH